MTGMKLLLLSVLLGTPITCDHLTGTVNRNSVIQLELLMQDVNLCTELLKFSLGEQIQSFFNCIYLQSSHCLANHDPLQTPELEIYKTGYCGSIAYNRLAVESQQKTMHIQLLPGFIIKTDFIVFYFELHPRFPNHGMHFYHFSYIQPSFYYGTRVPWRVITPNNNATFTTNIIRNMNQELNVFYSSFKRAWLSTIYKIDIVVFEKNAIYNIPLPFPSNNLLYYNVTNFQFYFLAKTVRHKLNIVFFSKLRSEMLIFLHDGPGQKSTRLLDVNCLITCNYTALTTAFIGFVKIENVTSEIAVEFIITIREVYGVETTCLWREPKNVATQIKYSKFKHNFNMVWKSDILLVDESRDIRAIGDISTTICLVNFNYKLYSLWLWMDLHFRGVAILADFPFSYCQYGGVFIIYRETDYLQTFCKTRLDYHLWVDSPPNIDIVIAWFPGYSTGIARFRLTKESYCRHQSHLGPDNFVNQTVKVDTDLPCQRFICPYYSNPNQCKFDIRGKSGNPIGTASISLSVLTSLYRCIDDVNGDRLKANVTAMEVTDWPLGYHKTSKISFGIKSTELVYTYLENATVSLPYICLTNSREKQMGFKFVISSCVYDKIHNLIYENSVQGTLVITRDCFKYIRQIPVTKSTSAIYKEDKTTNFTLSHIMVLYGQHCQKEQEQKNYTYSVFIWNRYTKTVHQITARIGTTSYTRFQFHGLRLTVIGATLPDDWDKKCTIHFQYKIYDNPYKQLKPLQPESAIWTKNSVTYRFYSERWV